MTTKIILTNGSEITLDGTPQKPHSLRTRECWKLGLNYVGDYGEYADIGTDFRQIVRLDSDNPVLTGYEAGASKKVEKINFTPSTGKER